MNPTQPEFCNTTGPNAKPACAGLDIDALGKENPALPFFLESVFHGDDGVVHRYRLQDVFVLQKQDHLFGCVTGESGIVLHNEPAVEEAVVVFGQLETGSGEAHAKLAHLVRIRAASAASAAARR